MTALMKNKYLLLYIIVSVTELVSEVFELDMLRYCVKPLMMITLGFYFYSETKTNFNSFAKKILGALVFSWAGDVLLMFPHYFLPGLISFLIAHIFYILAFYENINSAKEKRGLFTNLLFALPFLLFSSLLFNLLTPGLGEMMIPVAVYTSVITVMGIASALRYGTVSKESFLFVMLGAIIFISSDSTIAINKFMYAGELPYARLIIMSTYMLAQLLIVLGCLKHLAVKKS